MKFWIAIVLGLLQGFTEFFPLSSSGHLILAEYFLGVNSNTFFNLMLHFATLFAVVLFFWKDLVWCIKNPLSKQTLCLCLATICTALFAFGLSKVPGINDGIALGPCFILTGIILVVSQLVTLHYKKKKAVPSPISTSKAFMVGIVQGAAILPGLSRSGTTISSLRIMGMENGSATSFSFLLSIPVVVGGIVLELAKGGAGQMHIGVLPCLVAFTFAFGAGLVSLIFLKKLIKNNRWWVFAPYMIAMGILISIWQYA